MIRTIVDSEFLLDGGAMNGIVPRPLWSKFHPPDERGRIRLVTRCVLLKEREAGRLWLIDAGIGDGWDEKNKDIYGIKKVGGGVAAQLGKLGFTPDEVTDIVLSHLHFDHAAGVVVHDTDGMPLLAFPRARIYVQRKQLRWALKPSVKDAGSYRRKDVEILASCSNLVLLDGAEVLSPNVSVTPLEGHTSGMQTVTILHSQETWVVASDLVPIFSHVNIPWIMAYDNHPLTTVREKASFLERAARERWIVVSSHDADTEAAVIVKKGEGKFTYEPVDAAALPPRKR